MQPPCAESPSALAVWAGSSWGPRPKEYSRDISVRYNGPHPHFSAPQRNVSPLEMKQNCYLAQLKKRQQSRIAINLTPWHCQLILAFLKITVTWLEIVLSASLLPSPPRTDPHSLPLAHGSLMVPIEQPASEQSRVSSQTGLDHSSALMEEKPPLLLTLHGVLAGTGTMGQQSQTNHNPSAQRKVCYT